MNCVCRVAGFPDAPEDRRRPGCLPAFIPDAMMDASKELSRQLAQHAILAAYALYARATDRLDAPLLRSLFTSDCEIDMGAVRGSGHEALKTDILRAFATQQHAVSNVRVLLSADGREARTAATLSSRSLLKPPKSDSYLLMMMHARYLDEWKLEADGQWRISKRTLVHDLDTATPVADASWTSVRDPSDPSYAFFGDADLRSASAPRNMEDLYDWEAITERLTIQSLARDSRDGAAIARCVWPDSGAAVPKAPSSGPFSAPAPNLHLLSHALIVRTSPTTAKTETYAVGSGFYPNEERCAWGRYLDSWERRGDEWRMVSRGYVQDGGVARIPSTVVGRYLPKLEHLRKPGVGSRGEWLGAKWKARRAAQALSADLAAIDRGIAEAFLFPDAAPETTFHASYVDRAEELEGVSVRLHAIVKGIALQAGKRTVKSATVEAVYAMDGAAPRLISRTALELHSHEAAQPPAMPSKLRKGTKGNDDPEFAHFTRKEAEAKL
ncbi:hypothetical protein DFJ74DRAFT_333667 [Hyaloraphidium curvatum]|nr:hypothetical protein DFJ74DRAFT_333667 [Hyaloraphidium curvatum]